MIVSTTASHTALPRSPTNTVITSSRQYRPVNRYEDVQRELAAMKPALEAEYHVAELGIFGSFARDEQTEESDLDVLVEFERPVSLFDLVRLENDISDRLGIDVDLVTRNSLKPRVEASVDDDVIFV